MTRKKRITEEIQLDSKTLGDFKRTCNILELRYIRQLEELIADFVARKKHHVDNYLDRNVKEPNRPKNIRSGPELLYAIEIFRLESENDVVAELITWIREDLSLDREIVKRIKKNLAKIGVGVSKHGDMMYVAIKHQMLVQITGNRRYCTEMRRCEEYQETKTCGLAGKPVRCLVFDLKG